MNGKPLVRFKLNGVPKGKGRPKATTIGGHVSMYTPQDTVDNEQYIADVAAQAMGGASPTTEPVIVTVLVTVLVPTSWSEKKRKQALDGEIFPDKKPDVDNVIKSILDGMNAVVYHDDKQVVGLSIMKLYSTKAETLVDVGYARSIWSKLMIWIGGVFA